MQRDRVAGLEQREQLAAYRFGRGDVRIANGKVKNILPPDFLRAGVAIFKNLPDG